MSLSILNIFYRFVVDKIHTAAQIWFGKKMNVGPAILIQPAGK